MCYAEECEGYGEVIVTVVFGSGKKSIKKRFVLKPEFREEDLRRSKKIMHRNLMLVLEGRIS